MKSRMPSIKQKILKYVNMIQTIYLDHSHGQSHTSWESTPRHFSDVLQRNHCGGHVLRQLSALAVPSNVGDLVVDADGALVNVVSAVFNNLHSISSHHRNELRKKRSVHLIQRCLRGINILNQHLKSFEI
jgi:hypothetical protein